MKRFTKVLTFVILHTKTTNNMLKAIIIEDNPVDRIVLEHRINECLDLELQASFEDAVSALSSLKTLRPDVIFADVELPGMSGIEMINLLKMRSLVVVCSSRKDYAYNANESDATDFLLKPIYKERFLESVRRLKRRQKTFAESEDEDFLYLRESHEMKKIAVNKISIIRSVGDYIKVITDETHFMILMPLKKILELLPEDTFAHVHRSYIVNINMIDAKDAKSVKIQEEVIPVSKSGKKRLDNLLSSIQ